MHAQMWCVCDSPAGGCCHGHERPQHGRPRSKLPRELVAGFRGNRFHQPRGCRFCLLVDVSLTQQRCADRRDERKALPALSVRRGGATVCGVCCFRAPPRGNTLRGTLRDRSLLACARCKGIAPCRQSICFGCQCLTATTCWFSAALVAARLTHTGLKALVVAATTWTCRRSTLRRRSSTCAVVGTRCCCHP